MTMLSMETSLIRDGRGAMLLSYAGQLNTTTLLKGGTIEHYKAFSRLWNWPLPCILTVLSQREAQSIIVNSPLGNISLSWDLMVTWKHVTSQLKKDSLADQKITMAHALC